MKSSLTGQEFDLPPPAQAARFRMLSRVPFTKEEDAFILHPPLEYLRAPGRARAGQPDIRKMAARLNRSVGSVADRRVLLRKIERQT